MSGGRRVGAAFNHHVHKYATPTAEILHGDYVDDLSTEDEPIEELTSTGLRPSLVF